MSQMNPEVPTICFDSCGWGNIYHFGVAKYIQENYAERETPSIDGHSWGCSGGALVAVVLSLGLDVEAVVSEVINCQIECGWNPWRTLPHVERLMQQFIPMEAHKWCSGRVSILLSCVSSQPPFLKGELKTDFDTRLDLMDAMRGSCHVPILYGIMPYKGKYYDGFLFGSMFQNSTVPLIVSQPFVSGKSKHPLITPSQWLPPWWMILPPHSTVLWDMYHQGIADAAEFFASLPTTHPLYKSSPRTVEFDPRAFNAAVRQAWWNGIIVISVLLLSLICGIVFMRN